MAPSKRKAQFKTLVRTWGDKLGVEIRGLSVRPMRNNWTSCSSNVILSFHAELLELEPVVWNYVIVHELLHFEAPTNTPLRRYLPLRH